MKKTPIVLFALQSPPLLQLLKTSPFWDLRTELMGDHEGLAESAILATDPIPGLQGDIPDVVVVCSPAQLLRAKEMVLGWGKKTPIVWATHNGHEPELLDGWEGPMLAFSCNNLSTFALVPREHAYVIRPHVPIVREFKGIGGRRLSPAPFLNLRSRPDTRTGFAARSRRALLADALTEAGVETSCYGQGQPLGYLGWLDREGWFLDAAAYVSALPNNAGFGLAEHEALAHGCPLVVLGWGDTPVTLAGYRGLCASKREFVATLRERWEEHRGEAESARASRKLWAEEGYDALRTHYTLAIMDAGVRRFLGGLL